MSRSPSFNIMGNQYAIGIIIQKADSLTKLKNLFLALKGLVNLPPIPLGGDALEKVVFNDKPEAEVKFFVGIVKDVSSQTKANVGTFANYDNLQFLPQASFMYFGEDYSYEEMKAKLIQWIGNQWMGHYLIIDSGSDLADLLTKFIKY